MVATALRQWHLDVMCGVGIAAGLCRPVSSAGAPPHPDRPAGPPVHCHVGTAPAREPEGCSGTAGLRGADEPPRRGGTARTLRRGVRSVRLRPGAEPSGSVRPEIVLARAYPSLSTSTSRVAFPGGEHGRRPGPGPSAAAFTAALPGLGLVFIGGDEFADVKHPLWLFALAPRHRPGFGPAPHLLGAGQSGDGPHARDLGSAAGDPDGLRMDRVGDMVVLMIAVNPALLLALPGLTRRTWFRKRAG